MRTSRLGFLAVAVVLHSAPAHGQSMEVGGIVASACRGSEGSVCDGGAHVLSGLYLSWIVDDRVEIGVEGVRIGGTSEGYSIGRDDNQYNRQKFDMVPNAPARVDLAFVDRSRTLLLSRFLYHFLPGQRVRPLLGGEVGQVIDRQKFVCQPPGCESVVSLLVGSRVGEDRSHHLDLGFIAGASIHATDRIRLRFGIQLHDFAFEDLSTMAWFVETGVRFGLK